MDRLSKNFDFSAKLSAEMPQGSALSSVIVGSAESRSRKDAWHGRTISMVSCPAGDPAYENWSTRGFRTLLMGPRRLWVGRGCAATSCAYGKSTSPCGCSS